MSDFVKNAAFHDELAPRYDEHLAISPYNSLARLAFVDLVSRHVAPGSTLLDFGCGTGIDALEYARRGYRVLAYDNSGGMMAELERRCAAEIASGRISAWSEEYPSFLANFAPSSAPSAVAADFAVLNSIGDLAPLFSTLARRLAPPGWVILSILNPLHWLKLKTPGWWLKGLRQGDGSPVYATEPYVSYLHYVPSLLRAGRPFHLVGRANAGRLVRYQSLMSAGEPPAWWGRAGEHRASLQSLLWTTPLRRFVGHFVFLVLRRDL